MKIAHLADIHIRGLQYMDEMEYTFERLYESLEEEKPELIVVCGDLYHSKLTVTNEYFITCRKFLDRLSSIATTIIIPGNHDMALNNLSRVDAITPVVEAINHPSLIYSKHSELIFATKLNRNSEFVVNFWHFSCLDKKEEWPSINSLNQDEINIALYHGSINNCIVDNGWVSRGNKDDITLFDGFDFAFLGDIHKSQFMTPTIAYPGSLRQNNYGEDLEKGYLLWDISGKDKFTARQIILPQKRYFFTLYADSSTEIPVDLGLPEDSRIQVKTTKSIPLSEEIKIKNTVKKLYKPRNDVPVIPPKHSEEFGKLTFAGGIEIDNVRSPSLQKQLIQEYFKNDKNVSQETLNKIVKLDETYHSYINTDVLRNIKWKIDLLEWNNLFSYGEGNKIDFNKLSGLIGIFGKNGIGKSSIIDIFLYVMQNSINKEGATKNIEYINDKKDKGIGKANLSIDNKNYVIKRSTEKKATKKGEFRAINEIDFKRIVDDKTEKSLCGESLPDTNKKIRDYFGTLEDFNTISLISQFGGTSNAGLTSFIDARGTKRKEILAKFQDLGVFDEKYRIANEDAKRLKDKLTEHENKNYLQLIEEAQENLKSKENQLNETKKTLEAAKNKREEIQKQIYKLEDLLKDVKFDVKIFTLLAQESSLKNELKEHQKKLDNYKEALLKLPSKYPENLDEEIAHLQHLHSEFLESQKEINRLEKKITLLKTIPNVDACRSCSLAKDAYLAEGELQEIKKKEHVDVSEELNQKKTLSLQRVTTLNLKLQITKLEGEIETKNIKLNEIREKIKEQDRFINIIEKNKETEKTLKGLNAEKNLFSRDISQLETLLLNTSKEIGSLEEKLISLNEQSVVAEKLRDEYHIMQLYLDAMGKDGIAYMIMSQRLPVINKEVNHILSQVTNSRIFIEDDLVEKSIKIYMIDNKGKRPIELTSGAEKTMAAIAFRAALWNISSLPKSSLLVLDEPFGFLENEKYDAVLNLLSYLKNYFKHIILISHNEDIKATMDHVVYVEEDEDGFAHVEV